jgi:ubiquinone/menaquinone biosynthesis C-methylase UbiE
VDHFDHMAASGSWSRLYDDANGLSYHFHIRLMRALELLPQTLGCVADLGCGPGTMVEAVLQRGGTFHGVDLSEEMLHEAKHRFGGCRGVTFSRGAVESLPLLSGCADQVIAMGLIEYLRAPDRALAEIARILRPGGIAVVTVPRRWHIDHVMLALTAPVRATARAFGATGSDRLHRLRLQPRQLDAAAASAGLVADSGFHYYFTVLPYPVTRLAPTLSMRFNQRYERWHRSRSPIPCFFAHGYIGRYRKPAGEPAR